MISLEHKKKNTKSSCVLKRTICPDLRVRCEKLSLMREIDVFIPQAQDSSIMRIQYSEGIVLIGLMVDNVALWPAKTLERRKVTEDLRKGVSLEMLTIAKLIKTKVLSHQFSNLMFNLHYMCLLSQIAHHMQIYK